MLLKALTQVKFGTSGVRGLVSDLSFEVCYSYTEAFIQSVGKEAKQVVIGHDLRPSSPEITRYCITAIQKLGLKPIFVGALPTPAIAYYASVLKVPSIVVTGSHIPFDRNGIKFYRADGEISKNDEAAMLDQSIELPSPLVLAKLPEVDTQARQTFINRYVSFFGENSLKGFKVALYEHSSVARDVLREILQKLGVDVLSLGRTDVFVPIDTEAVRQEDIEQAKTWANSHSFDAILSTDGDGDRPLIGDELGQWLRGDVVGILCAKYLAADVVVTPVSSNSALEKSAWFKQIARTRIGSPYVIAGMESFQDGVIVGFEANGGFLLGSSIKNQNVTLKELPTRDAVLPILCLLRMAHEHAIPFSKLVSLLPERYTFSDRIQSFATEKSSQLIQTFIQDSNRMAAVMAPNSGAITQIDQTDGLRVTFENQDVVHLRPSGNAPELRCYAEASTVDHAKNLSLACLKRVQAEKTVQD